jgi:heavy metal translocating P-type ATPase
VPIAENAIGQLRAGRVTADLLIVIGVIAAFGHSYIAVLRGGAVYFETACMILVLVTLGRWLEASGKLRASAQLEALAALFPDRVDLIRDGASLTVRAGDVLEGDRMRVPAGRRIAADGVIETGRADIDEQLITGESTPVSRGPGDDVRAGTLNLDGLLVIRATRVAEDSTLGRLVALVESARRTQTRHERLADRVARVFVPATLVLALVGAVLGWQRGGAPTAIMTGLSVLLIACPCALGIATPMAVWVALGHAARRRILFRTGEQLERLAAIDTVCLDKTGTLTTGAPVVDSVHVRAGDDGPRVLAIAGALAATSDHVLARAIQSYASHARRVTGNAPPASTRGASPEFRNVRALPGRGLVAGDNGDTAALGSTALMRECNLSTDPQLDQSLRLLHDDGRPLACVGWAHSVRGVFSFNETLRDEARSALDRIRGLGCEVRVLTGDHVARGARLAHTLGVDVEAGLTPDRKLSRLRDIRARGRRAAMVGDGLNDAPALAAANVGIAMGCGADVTRASAGVCLLDDDLTRIPEAIALARRTVRTIRVNLFWAFAYNIAGIGLALAGWLTPIFAAGAMVVSSLLVIGNSLRLSESGDRS